MRGIKLIETIQLIGFKRGFSFWFIWSFIDPVRMWWWLNVSHKPYCTYAGYHCHQENCPHKHLTSKNEIKKHWENSEKECNRVEIGEEGKCIYCGEEKATTQIENPNLDELNKWAVCDACKEIIKIQSELGILSMLPNKDDKRIFDLNNRLLEIQKETGKEIFSEIFVEDSKGNYERVEK